MKTFFHLSKRCLLSVKAIMLLLLSIVGSIESQAQISFRNPTYSSGIGASSEFTVYTSPVEDNNQAVTVPAPGDGQLTADFSVTLFRPIGTTTQGYVAIHLGTYLPVVVTPDLTAAERPVVDNTLWTPALDINGLPSSTYEQLIVTGSFTISGNIAGNNSNLFAVFYDNVAGRIFSAPVRLRILPPDPIKNPILNYLPCGGDVLCGDQCVPYGSRPNIIKGRVLASYTPSTWTNGKWENTWNLYQDLCNQKGISTWGYVREGEQVDWQYSYDNSNWTNMQGHSTVFGAYPSVEASMRPEICKRTTYYRRVSSHLVSDWWWGTKRVHWYDSNVITITPMGPIPTTSQPHVTSCGGSVSVSTNADLAIATYNWWVPYAGWTITDGVQPPFSTFNSNSSFVTSHSTNIQITPAPSATPGDYVISFSTNGRCGPQSADGHLTVTVDYSATPAPTGGYFSLTPLSTACMQRYNLHTSPVAGAISYLAVLNDGSSEQGHTDSHTGEIVFFNLLGPLYNVSAQIFAIGPCGSSLPYDVPVQDLDYLRQKDSAGKIPLPCDEVVGQIESYPNPADNSLKLQAKSANSVGYLYNSQGKNLQTIPLEKANETKELDTSALPNGLYNLIIEGPNHERRMEHIVIKH